MLLLKIHQLVLFYVLHLLTIHLMVFFNIFFYYYIKFSYKYFNNINNIIIYIKETYTTLIPALIMGNTAVMKLPNYGVVCHYLTYQLFKDIFPAGVINIGI